MPRLIQSRGIGCEMDKRKRNIRLTVFLLTLVVIAIYAYVVYKTVTQ